MTNDKVLIVDDEAAIRDLIKMALGKKGYEVLGASGAEEALEILGQEKIPVILLDLGLETMNGFELCEIVRKDHPETIIYALSGHVGLFGPEDFSEAGFNGYEPKPIIIENIEKIIDNSFEQINQMATISSTREIKQVLIIDDDDQIRKMLRQILEHEGYTVSDASNGEEGYIRFSKQPVDLIVVDLVMPGKSGIETALAIKEDYPAVNIILMSGCNWYGIDAEFEMAKALCAATIKKPFHRKSILEVIQQIQQQPGVFIDRSAE